MSFDALKWAFEQPVKNMAQRCVLLALANFYNSQTGECYPSIATLSKITHADRRTIWNVIADLEKNGIISREKKHGKVTIYHLHLSNDVGVTRYKNVPSNDEETRDKNVPSNKDVPGTKMYLTRDKNVPTPGTKMYLTRDKNVPRTSNITSKESVKNTLSAGSTSEAEVSPSTEREQEAHAEGKDASSVKPEQKQKKPREQKPFEPPTLAQVQGYIKNMGYIVDGLEFWQYYERNGWQRVVKKVPQPMKNWKQEIQTWNKKRLANLEQSNDTAFEQFWAAYPNKINKGDAHKAFEEVRKLLPDNLVERVRLKASTDNWVKDDGKFVPQPAKWLRNHGWEDGDCQGVSREAAILIDEEKSQWQQPMGQPIKQQMIQQSLPFDM